MRSRLFWVRFPYALPNLKGFFVSTLNFKGEWQEYSARREFPEAQGVLLSGRVCEQERYLFIMNFPLLTKGEETRLVNLARKQGFETLSPIEMGHLQRLIAKMGLQKGTGKKNRP